jgi:amino-acid N-acetyltransferase
VKIEAASHSILAHVRTILTQAGLPTAGLDDQFPGGYVVAVESDEVAGCAGLEIYGRYGLVRSLAVNSRYQRAGVGRALVANRIAAARLLELASSRSSRARIVP